MISPSRACLIAAAIGLLAEGHAAAQTAVVTQDYDNARSGANLAETMLTPATVAAGSFGKVFAYPVDDEVFAQPLYVPGLSINGGTHNVVVIATMSNSVYAFDADNPATANAPLWSVNLGPPAPSAKFIWFAGSGLLSNGILSTPVIDPASNTLYVVSQLWNSSTQSLSFLLHALDLLTGIEKSGGPVVISAPGFNADVNIQRAGLLLLNGVLYLGIASHADLRNNVATGQAEGYVGMVLAYDAGTLLPLGSFDAEPGGIGAAVWAGGRGLASDGVYIYAVTANAIKTGTADYSESFVKLNPTTLTVADYFVDPNQGCLNTLDLDLSSAGPQVVSLDGANLLVGGGKQGKVYALDLSQTLQGQSAVHFWGTTNYALLPADGGSCVDPRPGAHGWLQGSDTALWLNPSGTSYYYALGNNDQLLSWAISGTTFTPSSSNTLTTAAINALALSANGGAGGILWVESNSAPAMLSAFNAAPAGGQLAMLWSSRQVAARDALGSIGRYSVPTVANGRVYVGTASNQVAVYGLLPTIPTVQVSAQTPTMSLTGLQPLTTTIWVNSLAGYLGKVNVSVSGLPPGASYSFSATTVTLSATKKTVSTKLTISPGTATLPLGDSYTIVVRATAANGATSYAPMRLAARTARVTAVSAGCNASNQMSADVSWSINGSGIPSLWIQDPQTPTFPGRPWLDPAAAQGTAQTDYSIASRKHYYRYWAIDQSAGIPATFDNALGVVDLGPLYKCP